MYTRRAATCFEPGHELSEIVFCFANQNGNGTQEEYLDSLRRRLFHLVEFRWRVFLLRKAFSE